VQYHFIHDVRGETEIERHIRENTSQKNAGENGWHHIVNVENEEQNHILIPHQRREPLFILDKWIEPTKRHWIDHGDDGEEETKKKRFGSG